MKKKLCFWIILITLVGMLPSLLQYGCYMIATDLSNQEVPFIIETKRMLMSGYPLWSWNHLLGDNFIGSYSFYTLTSPFVWFNCLFPDQWMLQVITFTLLLKMICVGLAAYAYLKKMSISGEMSLVGALMYTFSSFAISNLFYYHFLEPMIAFPIFLMAIERYLRSERYGGVCLALASFLVFFINYYFATCSMIAGLIYVMCRMMSKDIKIGLGKTIYGVMLVGVGVLMSAFILLPTIVHLQGNPRQSFDLTSLYSGFECCSDRLLTLFEPKLLEGENPAFTTLMFSSNAANVPVVGLMLAGLYVMRHRDWLAALVAIMVIFYVTPLNGLFSLFTNPSYTRWAYALTLFVILASMKYVDERQPVKMHDYWFYAIIASLAIAFSYVVGMYLNLKFNGVLFARSAVSINLITQVVFLVQMVVLFFYVKRSTPSMLLRCVIIMSMIYFPVRTLMNTDAFNKHGYRSEWTGSIKQYLLENHLPYHNGDFEWRTDFLAFYINVNMLKNRPAIATFSSIQSSYLSQLLPIIGSKVGSNTVKACKNVLAYDALTSVKEIIEYDNYLKLSDSLRLVSSNPELVGEKPREFLLCNKREGDGYTIYDNKYYIPMGYTYDSYIGQSAIDSLMAKNEQADIPMQMLASLVVPDSLMPVASSVMEMGQTRTDLSLDSIVNARRKTVCSSFAGDTRGFKATVTMPKKNLLFFSVPCDKGFKGYVDGVEATIHPVNLGLSAIMVDQGEHQVEFKFMPRGLREGTFLTLIGIALVLMIFTIEARRRPSSAYKHYNQNRNCQQTK